MEVLMYADTHSYVAVVLIITPYGVPLVRDRRMLQPHYWKLPGGKGEPGETPEKTAARELLEETGLEVKATDLQVIACVQKKNHCIYIFWGELPDVRHIKQNGDEGEEVKVFPTADVPFMEDLLPLHKEQLLKHIELR
jgi:ADP-ribose pyrophosphatase YjhB (NUDIX family)